MLGKNSKKTKNKGRLENTSNAYCARCEECPEELTFHRGNYFCACCGNPVVAKSQEKQALGVRRSGAFL